MKAWRPQNRRPASQLLLLVLMLSACSPVESAPAASGPTLDWSAGGFVTATEPAGFSSLLETAGAQANTPVPQTATPTPLPFYFPRGYPTLGTVESTFLLTATPATPVPTPMPPVHLGLNVVNILLLGSDQEGDNYRTDTMILVSINKSTGRVALLSIPRDLYVYVPQWRMQRINTADNHGRAINYLGGGPALLIQTLLYNFGIPAHFYARINFDGFKQVVDTLGGIDVPVSCPLDDYILKDPALDPKVGENWEPFIVPAGVQHLDGTDALLYARLRQSYTTYNSDLPRPLRPVDDFDRARRQQQVLRAIYRKALSLDIVPKIPALYEQFFEIVETDMGLVDVLQFVPLVPRVRDINISSYFISKQYTIPWRTPAGESVRLPNPETLPGLIDDVFFGENSATVEEAGPLIGVINGSSHPGWDVLAADRLAWAGFNGVASGDAETPNAETVVIDYTGGADPVTLNGLLAELRLSRGRVVTEADSGEGLSFRLIVGEDYVTCRD